MNLSNLLHDIRHTSKRSSSSRSNQHLAHSFQNQAAKTYGGDMASALTASPFQNQPPVYSRSPQPPPSPPVEDPNNKCTLPSIQSLIGMADVPASNQEQPGRLFFPRRDPHYCLTLLRSGRRKTAYAIAAPWRWRPSYRSSVTGLLSTHREQPYGTTTEPPSQTGFRF